MLATIFTLIGCASKEQIIVPVSSEPNFGSFPGKHGAISSVPVHITASKNAEKSASVVIVHGCNGPNGASYRDWADFLADKGITAIQVDLFEERGLTNICADGLEISLTTRSSVRDLESIAQWAKRQSWSNGKVGVIGFSLGAQSVLSAVSLGISDPVRMSNFSAAVAFYPDCRHYASRRLLVPLQVHIGKEDDWTPAEQCEVLATFWGQSTEPFSVSLYDDAHHGFDQFGLNSKFRCPRGQCTGRYNANADLEARAKTVEFFQRYLD
ncbi:MAG: dienelactone hydrolase family protein [Burkholderiaceae bacterium]|nr:dienelactone hydrolase family protein [Burkholderiaceae bacterium]